ncbi:hypothetical protein LENED_011006 [Lentinula edodes]|uniref:Uncharacterized protein n=1 Tax=Lentinula edodes TaxID=5353 RepID=A0A1Q3ENV9_LENED|nr:hypothetical protein LENED_011006 [Lentinula edodes]
MRPNKVCDEISKFVAPGKSQATDWTPLKEERSLELEETCLELISRCPRSSSPNPKHPIRTMKMPNIDKS